MGPPKTETRSDLPTRIAFCITELEPGGAERCLVELATRLDRRQFEPVVYCLGPRPAGNPGSLVDKLESAHISVHCFDARRLAALPTLLSSLRRRMKQDAPHIVQTFLFHANVLGALAARRAGVKRVVTGIRVAEKRATWHLVLARWGDRWVDRHVCVSRSVRDFSSARGRLPIDKLVVIPNGVDVARFAGAKPASPASLGRTGNRRLIACVGRLDEQKGVAWLLEAMPRVFAEVPGLELALVGEGPLRGRLESLAAQLGIADRVLFAGYRDNVPEILAASELVVLASRWEGMPNAVLEAMASGRPVVATDVAGVREALGEAADGQIVPPDDPREFARKVTAILGDNELASRLGQANQQRARQYFSLSAMVEAYERLYAALLSGAV
jgi:glycosyltransferase involved in cell wall biosynthesis